jgi:hypothetical protein
MAGFTQWTIDPNQGPLTLRLEAGRALPIKGVLSSRGAGHLEPSNTGDGSVIEWQLPAATGLYVTYGIVLPLQDVWFAPVYRRYLIQNGTNLSGDTNPRRFKTEKHADGEWVGPPEAFRIIASS